MKCTIKEQETCDKEKRGCKGCAYEEKSADKLFLEAREESIEYKEKSKCMYCIEREDKTINALEFDLKPTAGFENDRRYGSWIMKEKADKNAGIMIITNGTNGVYFDINYCPMCGRRL